MGCNLAALLASRLTSREDSSTTGDAPLVMGLVALCPTTGPHGVAKVAICKALLCIPSPIFNAWRRWDSRGGSGSPSVTRFVGDGADDEARLLQLRYTKQSKTAVWRRMAWGCLPVVNFGTSVEGAPGTDVWSILRLPVCLITGESDRVTPPAEAKKIARVLSSGTQGGPGGTSYPTLADATHLQLTGPLEGDRTDMPGQSRELPSRMGTLLTAASSSQPDASQCAGTPPLQLEPLNM
ncbi:dual specificity phosphatase catalytic domain containing protein [Grosmannia clavigera kw1407]|uniref:Dual specificity phosphatase catalytic domain containing protein n=1 Tax=Grosmannia clavigera (strain kw1407 / UAMH 11150) TaxID=655863 RepID=F0XIW0_GROCL|nr:dual specificity phosphatase catalytic domain containing protein [Grosmannia clavigera kw1407]EFX02147.1 dual specificity phosphatase catalytic domain containing protein [Grosmannia clavigera kw1407]